MKTLQNKLVQGTLLLTIAGFVTRLIGFAYRIFLADVLGAGLLGIYQLIFPVYGICFTIYGAGIQTAISQLIASNVNNSAKEKAKRELSILKCGILLSLLLSCTLSVLIFLFAEPIAAHFLLEPSCSPYLKLLCILFPFCGTSACINGYFYGRKEAKVPAVTQIIEQLVRVASVILMCLTFSATGESGCRFAILGLVFGEAASCFYNCLKLFQSISLRQKAALTAIRKQLSIQNRKKSSILLSLLFLAFTLTTTKLIISILHSVESVFIPAALKQYGCSPQEALSIYGILSGIALPFILFPSTVTNSFAVMLLPAIAQADAENDTKKIRTYVTLSGKYCLLIGYLFTCLFFLFGKEFGILLFHNEIAGTYIYILSWLCPFLYLSTTFSSIINGLGKTQLTFFITAVSLLIKICFLIFLVPEYGIRAYLIGTLLSQITMTLLEMFYLRSYIVLSLRNFFLIPGICLGFAGMLCKKLYLFLPVHKSEFSSALCLAAACLLLCSCYLLTLLKTGCLQKR